MSPVDEKRPFCLKMSITIDERELIDQLFHPTTTVEHFREYLDEEIYDLLKNRQNLKTIRDRVLFVNKNKYRPYDSVNITKFLRPGFDCTKTFEELFANLTPPYLTFIDFHFLFECSPEKNENRSRLKFQVASKASAINSTIKISSEKDYDSLIGEFKNQTHADLLDSVFRHHVDLYEFGDSGFKPYQLLSLVVHIQKFPQA